MVRNGNDGAMSRRVVLGVGGAIAGAFAIGWLASGGERSGGVTVASDAPHNRLAVQSGPGTSPPQHYFSAAGGAEMLLDMG